jgi:phenylacetate-coenzyme A ligase PaaK-like adenylate-forming protein
LVITPMPPFRETTLLLRYDTQDLVQQLDATVACELSGLPAVSRVLGRRGEAVRHAHGETYPRDVLEVLEALEDVPLPARYRMWAQGDGVGLDVQARAPTQDVRERIGAALARAGVPVAALYLDVEHSAIADRAAA